MELKGKYLNEETQQKGKKFFKTLGFVFVSLLAVMVVVGIILIIISSTQDVPALGEPGWFDAETNASGLRFGGIACIAFGIVLFGGLSVSMFMMAHQRDILAYQASTVVPVVGEIVENTTPVAANAIGTVVKSVKDAIVSPKDQAQSAATKTAAAKKVCAACATENSSRSKYCKNCGKELAAVKYCKNCGDHIDANEKFCEKCGTKTEQ